MAHPLKFPFPSLARRKSSSEAPIYTLGVPRSPDFRNDYTNMGPDVAAPWRKGGVFHLIPDRDIKAAGTVSDRQYTDNYGVRVRYSKLHSLHPWSANHMAASPGIEDTFGASDGQGMGAASSGWPVGFPHPFSEMVRRKYAIKSHTDPLWWFAIVFVTDGQLPNSNLVRNKMRYKLQSALQAALRQRGYAANGRRLEGAAGAKAKYSQLYGSMRADGPLVQILDAPYDNLVGFLAKAVIVVEGLLGRREQAKQTQRSSEGTDSSGITDGGTGSRIRPQKENGNPGKRNKAAAATRGPKAKKNKDRFSMLLDPSLF
jgi:hypothetical protein